MDRDISLLCRMYERNKEGASFLVYRPVSTWAHWKARDAFFNETRRGL